jgi:PAS domain S-box-containing protein
MRRILIVDDENGILEELSDYLSNGYEIVTARSASEAIKLLEAGGIELAIIDMYMETEESGIEVLKSAKKTAPLLQCIILTAYGTPSNVVAAMRAGAYDYVEKQSPDIYETLAHRIKKALEYRDSIEALRKSEEKYQLLIENLNEVVFMMDTQGYITYISPVVQQKVGYKPSEIMDKHFNQFVYSDDQNGVMENFYSVMSNELSPYEFRILDKNNNIHYVRVSSRPIMEEGVNCIIGSLVDITEQRQAEELREKAEEDLHKANRILEETLTELKTTQQKVMEQERLRDMGQLASGITHGFNNILTPILGYSDYMLNKPEVLDNKETTKNYLSMIKSVAEDGRELGNRLSKFYRKGDENGLIEQVILITQPKWKTQAQANGVMINILTDLQDIPLISGKESELREVLTNLIFNAVDAMTKNGIISLHTRAEGKNIILEVSDSGIGMTEEIKKRCFELFFSTKDDAGTGLGLPIAYGIIQRHKGTIEVESERGKGTKFIINLPITTEKQSENKLKATKNNIRPLRILIVDDEKPIQRILSLFLTADGHTFELASNGLEGLEKFKSGKFDLVITDKAMPDMGGDKLADYIKQIMPKMPIIMITGFGNIMEASGEIPKNIDCLVSKPLIMDELRKALAETIQDNRPA